MVAFTSPLGSDLCIVADALLMENEHLRRLLVISLDVMRCGGFISDLHPEEIGMLSFALPDAPDAVQGALSEAMVLSRKQHAGWEQPTLF